MQDPNVKKECVVNIYKDNFKTNLSGFEATAGKWYVDDEVYLGSHNDNAFMFANMIKTDKFKYEVDVNYESGILNFVFQSQTKNAFEGCYSLQLNGNTVRLFDFKNDYTFVTNDTLVRPEDNNYHVEINVDGNKIQVLVNGKEYINTTIMEADRQYNQGYVGLGLFNAAAKYQNFYVTTDTPITVISTKIDDLTPAINASLKDIEAQLPTMVNVAGDDGINKKDQAAITWNLDAVNVSKPGTYKITGTIEAGLTTTVNVIIRNNKTLAKLVEGAYSSTDYTAASYQAYLAALDQAKAVLANGDANQETIDQAAKALTKAVDNLVSIKELAELVKNDEKIDQSLYSPASYQKYLDVLNQAKNILANDEATQSEIDDIVSMLEKAIKGLEVIEVQEIDQNNNPIVKTGDTIDPSIYFILSLISMGSLFFVIRRKALK